MAWWTDRVVPRMVDLLLDNAEVNALRARNCAGLAGDVVEVGFGSGLNVPYYPPAVRSVAAVEPSDLAWRLAEPRISDLTAPVERAGLDGQSLDLPDASYDAAVSSFTMCTLPDLDAALVELTRVLRPGGRLHFVEHGRADDDRVRRWQRRLQPVHGRLAGGCHIDRPIAEHLDRSGLHVEHLETFYNRGPKPFSFVYLGTAVRTP